jgi:predicted metalloprotease with PDZ domain
VLRRQFPGRASWGEVRVDARSGAVRISTPPLSSSPAYAAGLDTGDTLRQIDGSRMTGASDVTGAIARHKPGDTMTVQFVDRTNVPKTASVTLIEDARLELVPIESTGVQPTGAQKAFRERWLGLRN